MNELAPIVLFLYNRPDHSKRTLDALAQNPEAKDSQLFIYCDGAKPNSSEEQLARIREVRLLAQNENRFKVVKVIEQDVNKGLANSITFGVSKVVNEYGKVIVLEDDILVSKFFLSFMNDSLVTFKDEEDVICISGYTYPVGKKLPDTFFIKVAECWGWATWKRGWDQFETDGTKLLNQIIEANLTSQFDFENNFGFTQMLKDQIAGRNNSWAILWYASAFIKNKYCFYASNSLVQNIGNDGSGTHSLASKDWEVKLLDERVRVKKMKVSEDKFARKLISNYFGTLQGKKSPLIVRIKNKIKTILKK